MTINRCDNCRRPIKDVDYDKLTAFSGLDNDFVICGKCKTKLIDLIAKSEMFADSFKDQINIVDPTIHRLKTLKKS